MSNFLCASCRVDVYIDPEDVRCGECKPFYSAFASQDAELTRLREAVEYAEDVFMGTIIELPHLESTVALDELRRRAGKEGGR